MPSKPTTTDTTDETDAIRIMNVLHHLVRELRESSALTEKSWGLSSAQLFVLTTLAHTQKPSGMTINDLANSTTTHQSSVSTVVTRLQAKGLVKRTPSPHDKRAVLISATSKGLALVKRTPPPFQDRLIAALRHLDAPSRRRLAGGMEKWIASLGMTHADPAMFFEPEPE